MLTLENKLFRISDFGFRISKALAVSTRMNRNRIFGPRVAMARLMVDSG